MSIRVLKAGLQTTLQGAPFTGYRHLGMPASGAADCVSLALANFLVGKPWSATAFEITLTESIFEAEEPCSIAVVGAAEYVHVNGQDQPRHQTLKLIGGDRLHIGPSHPGCRTYFAVAADIQADLLLGGQSTCLAAGVGGFHGRALRDEDIITFSQTSSTTRVDRTTPPALRPRYGNDNVIRVTSGPEANKWDNGLLDELCGGTYTVGSRASRMGLELAGAQLVTGISSDMSSAAVFPGTIQLPPEGRPYLLGPDAQTTGGYPRIAQVIRADRHLIGQLSSGSRIQFVHTTTDRATEIHREKLSQLSSWLGQINLW